MRHALGSHAVLALMLWALGPDTASAKDEWFEVRSAHFLVIGNASKGDCQSAAFRLEQFRSVLRQLFPQAREQDATPTTVVLLKDDASFQPLLGLEARGGARQWASQFQAGSDRNYVAIKVGTSNPYRQIYWNYIHITLDEMLGRPPVWLSAGFAEFYQTAEITDKHFLLGKVEQANLERLQTNTLIPVEDLFAMLPTSPYLDDPEKSGLVHAESWALVHYFMVGKGLDGHKLLSDLLGRLSRGDAPAQAMKASLGRDPAALQKELAEYVRRRMYQYYSFEIAKAEVDKKPAVLPLGVAAREFHLGDYILHTGRFPEAKPYFERAIAADPGFAAPYASLGWGYSRAKNYDEAEKAFSAALERAPADARIRLARAESRVQSERPLDDAAAATTIDDLLKGVEAASAPYAYDLLGYLARQHEKKVDEATAALRKGAALYPAHPELLVRLSDLLIFKKDYDAAAGVLTKAVGLITDPEKRQASEANLKRVTELAAMQAAAAQR